MKYDIIVVGAGHAGIEAACIASKLKLKTLLITISKKSLANLPCNPSMGGPAKGTLIKEVDALGGVIAKACDAAAIQKRLLNVSKGPAVWAIRMQIDKDSYRNYMLNYLSKQKNLTLIEDIIDSIIVKNNKVYGVISNSGEKYLAKSVILTTGTYMSSKILIGKEEVKMGPDGHMTTYNLSKNLKELGFNIIRLKTGTPPRLLKDSINFTKTTPQKDLDNNLYFSIDNVDKTDKDFKHLNCFITKTTTKTKKYILNNLKESPMYSGVIKGLGPRYCPSLEDKMVRFPNKEVHQVFLEPETYQGDSIYPQGLSTSLARHIQRSFVKTVIGLENVKIKKYGYAIEYDAISSLDLKANLETKKIANLFTAGQINGTSGYEEAAAQGIIAGINAYLKLSNEKPFILKRYDAYIGVLIDDLITKGTTEPYRMLTSCAEHRLILRNDNAISRLRKYALKYNILDKTEKKVYNEHIKKKEELLLLLNNTHLLPSKANSFLESIKETPIKNKTTLKELFKRPNLDENFLKHFINLKKYSNYLITEIITEIKYEGYIKKEFQEVKKLKELEDLYLGDSFNYNKVANLSYEGREKLNKVKPETLGQASRILGVSPSDISILMIYLRSISKR